MAENQFPPGWDEPRVRKIIAYYEQKTEEDIVATEVEEITIPTIVLEWCEWVTWESLQLNVSAGGTAVPNGIPGVYEVRYVDSEERLTIGKAADLRKRVKRGLVQGKLPHSSGAKIRAFEDVGQILVRWAVTDRPSAVEEELHRRYRLRFSELPKYVKHT